MKYLFITIFSIYSLFASAQFSGIYPAKKGMSYAKSYEIDVETFKIKVFSKPDNDGVQKPKWKTLRSTLINAKDEENIKAFVKVNSEGMKEDDILIISKKYFKNEE